MTPAHDPDRPTAVLAYAPAEGGRPTVTYRQAGERSVLVEYGDHTLDLRLNFLVVAMLDRLATDRPAGLVEAVGGLRSILVQFRPDVLARDALLRWLDDVHRGLPEPESLVIGSRIITLPIAFDDAASADAIRRYVTTIRHDAPNVHRDSNIDYIVECNGLADRDALYERITSTAWWAAFTGFTPGLPFLFGLDTRPRLSVPKYNPTRRWTPEGAVGMGGPCVAIYPVESPGSFQLFGRTVPIADLHGRDPAHAADPFLIRPGDRVRFVATSEQDLDTARQDALEGRWPYDVVDAPFAVAEHHGEPSTGACDWQRLDVP